MLSFGSMKVSIHVLPNVANDWDKYQYRENVTSATVWFQLKVTILYEKFYLNATFVLTIPGVNRIHPRFTRHATRHWEYYFTYKLLKNNYFWVLCTHSIWMPHLS